ncbi:Fe(3+) dicitrate ABC transporter substrate-binding protein [Streptosporangium sp. NPDC048865]|uniref:ABC transporter substrate-binding protein n=1 Tax=Streptosporangium sp. NPDC048865 TaxID=3155766 RepID=UPI00342A82C5
MSSVLPRPVRPLGRVVLAVAALLSVVGLSACSSQAATAPAGTGDASARSITHELGTTKIEGRPARVVALEFSFVQTLDQLKVTPVGIADDDDAARVPQLLGRKIDYTSVGTRLEPNLELVSSLQPDLIIADSTRHAAIYPQLGAIAPTIVLNSWEGSYQDIKDSAVTIADALGDRAKGEAAVAEHEKRMKEIAEKIPAGSDGRILLAVATPDAMTLHTSSAFTGSVFKALGLKPAIEATDPLESGVGLERLVAVNPDVLLVATDGPGTVYDEWRANSAWAGISAVASKAVHEVDRNQFARFRGLHTAEVIAGDVVQKLSGDR